MNGWYDFELGCGEICVGEEFVIYYDVDYVGGWVIGDDVGSYLCISGVGIVCEGRDFIVFYFDYEI